jgi:hypothetical protein
MSRGMLMRAGLGVAAGVLLIWIVSQGVTRLTVPRPMPANAAAPAQSAPQVPHIGATLFLAAPGGEHLVAVRREVPLASSAGDQGREIVTAQLEVTQAPLVSAIPPGTRLRAFYITEKGDAFVDLSPEAVTAHPGGSTTELLTIYSIVNAVTANLTTIRRVQILVDGKEVDTLAGHVDLRRALAQNSSIVGPESTPPAAARPTVD